MWLKCCYFKFTPSFCCLVLTYYTEQKRECMENSSCFDFQMHSTCYSPSSRRSLRVSFSGRGYTLSQSDDRLYFPTKNEHMCNQGHTSKPDGDLDRDLSQCPRCSSMPRSTFLTTFDSDSAKLVYFSDIKTPYLIAQTAHNEYYDYGDNDDGVYI